MLAGECSLSSLYWYIASSLWKVIVVLEVSLIKSVLLIWTDLKTWVQNWQMWISEYPQYCYSYICSYTFGNPSNLLGNSISKLKYPRCDKRFVEKDIKSERDPWSLAFDRFKVLVMITLLQNFAVLGAKGLLILMG